MKCGLWCKTGNNVTGILAKCGVLVVKLRCMDFQWNFVCDIDMEVILLIITRNIVGCCVNMESILH